MFYKATICALIICVSSSLAMATELQVTHTDPAWSGDEVPAKGICLRRGGGGMSPAIRVANIPADAATLELFFTDEDYGSEGGHGGLSMAIAGESTVEVPSFKGPGAPLPANLKGVQEHHCGKCDIGYYNGPCSGGKGHRYTVYVYASNAAGERIAQGKLALGSN